MKIRIEGDGHCVEIETADGQMETPELTKLGVSAYQETKGMSRTSVGFGSQLVERSRDAAGFSWRMGEGEQPTVTA